jgi:hypothetical protein
VQVYSSKRCERFCRGRPAAAQGSELLHAHSVVEHLLRQQRFAELRPLSGVAALLRAEGGMHGYECLLLECDACIVQPVLREQLAGARNTVVVPKDRWRATWHLLKFGPQFVPGCKKTGMHPSPPLSHAWL